MPLRDARSTDIVRVLRSSWFWFAEVQDNAEVCHQGDKFFSICVGGMVAERQGYGFVQCPSAKRCEALQLSTKLRS